MEKIPIKKLDSTFIIEYYCEKCGDSITYYPELEEIEDELEKNF